MKRKLIALRTVVAVTLAGVSLFYCPAMQGAREKEIYLDMNEEEITSDHLDQERVEVKEQGRGF